MYTEFAEGFDAYNDLKPISENPYAHDTETDKWEEWQAGWEHGEACDFFFKAQ